MENINASLRGRLVVIKNYKYSPYFKALVKSKTSDKVVIDALLSVVGSNIIINYILHRTW